MRGRPAGRELGSPAGKGLGGHWSSQKGRKPKVRPALGSGGLRGPQRAEKEGAGLREERGSPAG